MLIIILLVSVMHVHWPCSQNLQCIYIEMITISNGSSFLSLLSSQSASQSVSQSVNQSVSQSVSQSTSLVSQLHPVGGQSASHYDYKAKKSKQKEQFYSVTESKIFIKADPKKA